MKECGCITKHEIERKEVNAYRRGLRKERKRIIGLINNSILSKIEKKYLLSEITGKVSK